LSNSEKGGEPPTVDRRLLSDIRASAGCTNYAKCNTWGTGREVGVARPPPTPSPPPADWRL